jgi:hypothetical protein
MSGLGLGLGLGLGSRGGGGYDAATVTYLAAMGANQPTAAQAAAINARIVAIKAHTGLWDKLYALYFLDIHNAAAALINVKTPGIFNCTNTNCTFASYAGYIPDGDNEYLNTGFNPSVSGNVDSASLFCWAPDGAVDSLAYLIGAYDGTNISGLRRTQTGQLTVNGGVNCALSSLATAASGTISGLMTITRNVGAIKMYQNTTEIYSAAQTKTALPNANVYIGNVSNYTTAENTGKLHKVAGIGTHLEAADVAAIYNAINSNPVTA